MDTKTHEIVELDEQQDKKMRAALAKAILRGDEAINRLAQVPVKAEEADAVRRMTRLQRKRWLSARLDKIKLKARRKQRLAAKRERRKKRKVVRAARRVTRQRAR